MIHKPYYRIYRPFDNNSYEVKNWQYIEDVRNCDSKTQLIRVYQIIESEVINFFQYVEPNKKNENTFSLHLYHLLVKICIEIENNFKGIIQANDYNEDLKKCNITDYFNLNKYLKLSEYRTNSCYYDLLESDAPYEEWDTTSFKSLPWYQAYNSVKHNRETSLHEANLKNVLSALAGLYILLYAQFSSYADCISSKSILTITTKPTKEKATTTDIDKSIIVFPKNMMGYSFFAQPEWKDEEKYSFDWNVLAKEANPYQKLKILPS